MYTTMLLYITKYATSFFYILKPLTQAVVVNAFNPSTQKVEADGSEFEAKSGLHSELQDTRDQIKAQIHTHLGHNRYEFQLLI